MSTKTINIDKTKNEIHERVPGGELVFKITTSKGKTELVEITVNNSEPLKDELRKRNLDPEKHL